MRRKKETTTKTVPKWKIKRKKILAWNILAYNRCTLCAQNEYEVARAVECKWKPRRKNRIRIFYIFIYIIELHSHTASTRWRDRDGRCECDREGKCRKSCKKEMKKKKNLFGNAVVSSHRVYALCIPLQRIRDRARQHVHKTKTYTANRTEPKTIRMCRTQKQQ